MADASFDVVSKVDRQEVDNALNQAGKELSQRFDFRGTNATIAWAGDDGVTLQADTEERVSAALEVFKEKLIKRGISLKVLDAGEPQASGKVYKIAATIKQGIESDVAKKIAKLIRDEGPKGVQAQIQGDQLRVSGKKRDDLQAVQQLLAAPTSTSPSSSTTTAEQAHLPRLGQHGVRRIVAPAAMSPLARCSVWWLQCRRRGGGCTDTERTCQRCVRR